MWTYPVIGSSPRRSRAATSAGPVAPTAPTGTSVYTPSSAKYAPQASKSLRYRSSQTRRTGARFASVCGCSGMPGRYPPDVRVGSPPMATQRATSGEPAIEVDGLVKCFGDVEAVRGVSFEVPQGRVLGLLGPNGAGKTTVVRMLTTLTRPDGGTARVLGLDVVAQPQRVRNIIGLAGQYAAIDENLTGRENLRLVGKLSHLPAGDIGVRADALL